MNESLDKKIQHRNAVARAHSQVTRGQTSTLMVKESPAYSGRWREILPIVLVNVILTFLTVGIYRFWAKTRIRRYFLSRVSFLNDPLEYTGTGLELFKGFLIILAVLVPIFIVTGMLQPSIIDPEKDLLGVAMFQVGYALFFYFLYNVAVYRAQRYRLSRTRWRGIRAGQEGSALLYAVLAMILGVLNLVTIGLLNPVVRRILVGYRINNASFGTQRLTYQGSLSKLYSAWLVPWLLGIATIGVLIYAAHAAGIKPGSGPAFEAELKRALPSLLGTQLFIFFGGMILCIAAYIWYRAFEMRHWMNNTKFDQLGFESRINPLHLFLPYAAYFIVIVALTGGLVYGLWHFLDLAKTSAMPVDPTTVSIIFTISLFFMLWIVGGLLQPVIILNWLINNICATLTIQGSFSPDTLFQNQLAIPQTGEGLADALDIDAF